MLMARREGALLGDRQLCALQWMVFAINMTYLGRSRGELSSLHASTSHILPSLRDSSRLYNVVPSSRFALSFLPP